MSSQPAPTFVKPNNPFATTISTLVAEALTQLGVESLVPTDLAALLTRPPQQEWGDFALPCFTFAKVLRRSPNQIAEQVSQLLQPAVEPNPLLEWTGSASGYVNIRVSAAAMADFVIPAMQTGTAFLPAAKGTHSKWMVEYSQPNTHKAFHVGHIRNVALGDALVRLLRYSGHEVVAANYIGDSGTHIARCLWFDHYCAGQCPPLPEEQADPHPRAEWLGQVYSQASQQISEASAEQRKAWQPQISTMLHGIESQSQENQPLESQQKSVHQRWLQTRQWSLLAFDDIYQWLDAHFDHVFYESELDQESHALVDAGLESGVFVHSEGAVGIDLDIPTTMAIEDIATSTGEHSAPVQAASLEDSPKASSAKMPSNKKLGFMLVRKQDGSNLYATKDLALARRKFEQFGITQSVYVVGAEQQLHFQQVFQTLVRMGYAQVNRLHHLSYGLVMLPEGKMSSRAGNTILFSDLRRQLTKHIDALYLSQRTQQWDAEEMAETNRRLAVAAIRYGMIRQDAARSIIFKMEDWLASEGDTGIYLCYTYTRLQSIARQAAAASIAAESADFTLLTEESERTLIRLLFDFADQIHKATEALAPNMLANALFALCKACNRAYGQISVLHATTPELATARLALFVAVGNALKQGLTLLGITPPERM